MGVYEGRGQLSRALKDLKHRWLETKSSWDDANADAFEEKYLGPLEADMRTAVSAMDTMAVLLAQAHHDCEE
jgi:hypothetical protein